MGSSYLSVVQSIEPLAAFVNVVYWIISLDGSILCTMAKAEFDDAKANEIFTISIVSVVLIGVIVTVSGFLFPDFYMQILYRFSELKLLVNQYFLLYILGIPFTCFIVCTQYANGKYDDEYSGFFLIKQNDEGIVFEHTINGNIQEAVDLARDINEYLSANKSAVPVSLAVEEMLVNIININESVDTINVIVRNSEGQILISIKDMGIRFNLVVENEGLEFDNINVLNRIADNIDYSQILGLNNTVITIKN